MQPQQAASCSLPFWWGKVSTAVEAERQAMSCASTNAEADLSIPSFKTLQELKLAREATARYKDINNAFADGYIDIHVVMENMGYHFENPGLVDSTPSALSAVLPPEKCTPARRQRDLTRIAIPAGC